MLRSDPLLLQEHRNLEWHIEQPRGGSMYYKKDKRKASESYEENQGEEKQKRRLAQAPFSEQNVN